MIKVGVLGGRRIEVPEVEEFSLVLGRVIVSRGFILVTGGVSGVGELASRGAAEWLRKQGMSIDDFIISLLPFGIPPIHPYGRVIHRGRDWRERRRELARFADYFIAVSGGEGTLDEMEQVIRLGKPLLPIGRGEGTALPIWKKLMREERDEAKRRMLERVGPDADFDGMAEEIGDYLVSLREKEIGQ